LPVPDDTLTAFDAALPYPSRRPIVVGRAAVATSVPAAGQAGLDVLREGGSAADAAIAMAAALTVVEPTSNGLGGDCFAIVHDGTQVHGLDASGRSPGAWEAADFPADKMPLWGPRAVTVPGQIAGWAALHGKFGRLPFERLLRPAIGLARDGFPLTPITAAAWQRAAGRFGEFEAWRQTFLFNGEPPRTGQLVRLPDHAATLEHIAADGGADFYRGKLAEQIAAAGFKMTPDDLAAHEATWAEPLAVGFCGATVHELPPAGQGIAASQALAVLDRLDLGDGPDDPLCLHWQIEATKRTLADAYAHVADPAHMRLSPADLLANDYLDQIVSGLRADVAADPRHGDPRPGGTVYFAAADANGMSVSFIQSNYHGFGSGVVVPGTGIALQNRGAGFVTTPGHANRVGGGKKPFHTIIPGLLTMDGRATAFGVMGGPMQAQGHVQTVVRRVKFGQNWQASLDAPRWQVMAGRRVIVEAGVSETTRQTLADRGHEVEVAAPEHFGGGQAVEQLGNGVLHAASDWRKDGQALAVP
jgi:gamma-glutamyltranspeptidase/glutathione hydrolase